MTIAELIKEIIDSSKQRTKSPITGTYFLSFILWNWRPIFLLLFENTTISNKIIIINNEYSNFWTFLAPLIITIIYAIIVPFLGMFLDKATFQPKKSTIKNIYRERAIDIQEKIIFAREEIKLQDIISRKNEGEDLLEQIEKLKNKIDDDEEANKAILNDYKTQIFKLTSLLNKQNETIYPKNSNVSDIKLIKSFTQLSEAGVKELETLSVSIDEPIPNQISVPVIQFLIANEYAIYNNDILYLSIKGSEFIQLLKSKK